MGKKKADKNRAPAVDGQPTQAAAEPGNTGAGQMKKKVYREELAALQIGMFRLQEWVQAEGLRLVVLLEGLGPAGKRGTANRIAEGLDRRVVQVITLDPPSKRERNQWHFQRFVEHFPKAGRITIFDGSWYHQPAIERALGLLNEEEFGEFLRACAEFERTLRDSGITLIKYWFSADDLEQEQRFRAHVDDLIKRKKLHLPERKAGASPVLSAEVRDAIFAGTGGALPWYVVEATEKRRARLNCIAHLLSRAPGGSHLEQPAGEGTTGEEDGVRLVRGAQVVRAIY